MHYSIVILEYKNVKMHHAENTLAASFMYLYNMDTVIFYVYSYFVLNNVSIDSWICQKRNYCQVYHYTPTTAFWKKITSKIQIKNIK